MGIFQSLMKAAQVLKDDLNTPESFKKGEAFEDFVRKQLFTDDRYKLIHKTQGYSQNSRDYVENSKQPDFTFQCLDTKRNFYVEAKYRNGVNENGALQYANPGQFERHKKLNAEQPVFICLGVAGKPASPDFGFIIPIIRIKSVYLTEDFLEEFEIPTKSPIASKKLWSLVAPAPKRNQVHNSGYCIRCKKSIELSPDKPLCSECYKEWKAYSNPDYVEKYCHSCGKPNKGSIVKPVCYNCYKKLS
ncbi:MAG: hypothetical protein LDLANPLL_00448 [Turneriella sp.]|nr:hypothetical protein [Turneriella sp.]